MFARHTCTLPTRGGNLLRRLVRFSAQVLRALLIGAAAFGPPRPRPEPPPPQTTEQASERLLQT